MLVGLSLGACIEVGLCCQICEGKDELEMDGATQRVVVTASLVC